MLSQCLLQCLLVWLFSLSAPYSWLTILQPFPCFLVLNWIFKIWVLPVFINDFILKILFLFIGESLEFYGTSSITHHTARVVIKLIVWIILVLILSFLKLLLFNCVQALLGIWFLILIFVLLELYTVSLIGSVTIVHLLFTHFLSIN